MGISLRDDLLDEMITTLKTITVANGYYSAVGDNVSEELKDLTAQVNFPCLFLIDSDEDKAWKDVDGLMCTLKFLLIGYVQQTKNDLSTGELLRKLMADAEKCLCADRRRNLLALTTRLTNFKTDEGDLKPYGVFNCDVIVEYNQKYGDPSLNG